MGLDPVSAALNIGSQLIDRLWPDPAQAAAAKLQLLQMQQSGDLAVISGNMDINKAEAANSSVFVSGWRPAVGWVCVAAFAWNMIGIAIARIILAITQHPVQLSPADLSDMMPILIGMLGLGGLRTVEKINGVASQ